jgi:perosamine synthetase
MTVIDEFEAEFSKFTGVKHSIACCNGTAAMHTALSTLGITRGDKVVTTPFTFMATSNAILYCGATPVFADINPETYCIDPDAVAEVLTNDVKAILCVHLFGNVCDVEALTDFEVPLIEDCAQALGAKYNGVHVGNFGEFGCFSFYATKNLWTFEGGMIVTNNDELAERARMFINHGRINKNTMVMLGHNYRMPQICALVGYTQLKLHKHAIVSELGSYGLERGYYPYVVYDQPLYKKLGLNGNCPNAERIAQQVREMNR